MSQHQQQQTNPGPLNIKAVVLEACLNTGCTIEERGKVIIITTRTGESWAFSAPVHLKDYVPRSL